MNYYKAYQADRAHIASCLVGDGTPWRTCILSTGERPITYKGCSGALRNRIIEINTAASALSAPFVAKGNADSKSCKDAKSCKTDTKGKRDRQTCRALNDAVEAVWTLQRNYGFAGRKFITHLMELGAEAIQADYERMKQALINKEVSGGKAVEAGKAGEAEKTGTVEKVEEVAVIALADYYSSLAVFGVKGKAQKAQAWNEAVNVGKRILKEAI